MFKCIILQRTIYVSIVRAVDKSKRSKQDNPPIEAQMVMDKDYRCLALFSAVHFDCIPRQKQSSK